MYSNEIIKKMNSRLILGTVQMGIDYGINNNLGKISSNEIFKILDEAYNNGIEILDTAEAYGSAMSEIGEFQNKSNKYFKIINKFNGDHINLSDKLKTGIEILNVKNYYGYLFHNISDLEDSKNINELLKEKSNGRILKIGVSIYTNEEFEKAISIPEIDIIQFPFNLLDNSKKRLKLIQKAKSENKELHIRSIFLQGLIYKSIDDLPLKLLPLKPYLLKIKDIANRYNITVNEMALQYALSFDEIDYILIGVDSIEHLKNNLNFIKNKISTELKEEISSIDVKEESLLYPMNWN